MKNIVLVGLIFFVSNALSQSVPNKSFAENLSGVETANDAQATETTNSGGDLSLTVPLVTVTSKTMTFPIQLQYASGITVDQQSGPVGLGWVLPIGSIVRDYGAFEPDYTSTKSEVNMINANGISPNGWLGGDVGKNPFYNNQDLTYEVKTDFGAPAAYSIPDEYHVNVPGFFSNTFWNGSNNATFDWMFKNDVPYQVDNTEKTFEISQEFSRINEANLEILNASVDYVEDKTKFDKASSFATAIGLLPYVKNGEVWNPNSGGSFNPQGYELYVKYEDFESFTITSDDGVSYVFGRPLRGQKYLISEDPYWSTVSADKATRDGLSNQATEGDFWKTDFIAEWLLTEIRSIDYIDENGNGIADKGDLGDWIRFEYTDPVKIEEYDLLALGTVPYMQEVPMYREWSNFSQTDRASSLMREKAYLKKIITPIQEIDFTISRRMEVDHDYYSKPANQVGGHDDYKFFYEDRFFNVYGDESSFDILYPVETMKYDEIIVKDNSKAYDLYENDNPVVGKVVMNYAEKGSSDELAVSDYLIRNNNNEDRELCELTDGNEIAIGDYHVDQAGLSIDARGKTTLLGVTFLNSEEDLEDTQEYTFEYADNPSYSEIHKREIVRKKFFPSLRQSNWGGNSLFDPVALNDFDYFTERLPGTTISVNPFDFLIDIPYKETYEKLNIASLADKKAYLQNTCVYNNPAPIVGSTLSYDNVAHPLHPVKDEMNYMITPDGSATGIENKDAWSLTKITYPTGASITFEYELDDFEMTEDESNWSIASDDIPMVSDYNNVAKLRSRVQSVANEDDFNRGDVEYDKTLTAAFETELLPTSGGIRLKKKTLNDGINPPVEINYEYGDGHFTALPAAYLQNVYSGFNSFISRERKRHEWEKGIYHSTYASYLANWTTDYDIKMRRFANTETTIDKLESRHFYETIKEIYPNGSSVVKTFANQEEGSPIVYDEHKLLYGRDIISTNRVKFIYTSEYKPTASIDLVKVESFEDGSVIPYNTESYTYDVVDLLQFSMWSNHSSYTYNNSLEVYVTLADGGGSPSQYNINLSSYSLSVGVGATGLGGFSWVNMKSIVKGPTFVNLRPANNFSLGFTRSFTPVNRWGQSKKQLIQKIENVRGTENTVNYTYEPTYGYPETITRSITEGDDMIEKVEYGFDTYSGVTTLFTDANMLRIPVRSTNYLNSINNANVLSASFTEFEFTHSYPRQFASYAYRTPTIDHQTGAFTLVPFTIVGSNPIEWQKVESDPLAYDTDGVLSLSRSNQIYSKQIVGYDRGRVKGVISSIEGEFDGTYSGFEDLPAVTDIEIGSLLDPEYWYYQDVLGGFKAAEAIIAEDISAEDFCGNEITYALIGSTVAIKVLDNYDVDGQIFYIGDQITIEGTYDVDPPYDVDTPLPTFNSTITNITPWLGSEFKFCFSDPLPQIYADQIEFHPNIEMTISRNDPYLNSKPSKTYKRTGDYSYQLPNKNDPSDVGLKTPVRPVIPPDNTLHNYPLICDEAEDEAPGIVGDGYYPTSCFINYEASVWVKHDYVIRRENASSGLALPYSGWETGGFVRASTALTSNDHNNSYIRGVTSPTLDIGQEDVKIVYKIWNADRTSVVDEGEYYLKNLNGNWKQYTIEIPLFKGAEGFPIDVYVENNEVNSGTPANRKNIYVDDLIIYPQGAQYNYSSYDKFGAVSHYTNNNDVFVQQKTDKWGRKASLWNGYGDQISNYEYAVSDHVSITNSTTETHWTGNNKYYKTRTYKDGFGKIKQTVVSDPQTNKRTVVSTNEYDDMGWLSKTYKPYSVNGHYLSSRYDIGYATKVENLFESDYGFEFYQYLESLEKYPKKTTRPRENVEPEVAIQMNRYRNAVAVGGVYGLPNYAINDLLIQETTDPEGNLTKNYVDIAGKTVLTEQELGNDYVDNADGTISFSGAANGPLQTWFEYDRMGRLIKTVDPDGKVTTYYFNSVNEQIKSISTERGTTEMRYNKYKQIRFSRSAKDAQEIAGAGVIDQFKYVKYDKWGRIIRTGMMREMSDANIADNGLGESYTAAVVFTDQSKIDDQNYPSDELMFNQINYEFEYDGTRATYDSDLLLMDKTHSNHTLNGNYKYIPSQTDETTYTYLLDGNVKSKSFLYDEFTSAHVFNYEYNRLGMPIEKNYTNPTDASFDYNWKTTYDNFGRPVENVSGTLIDFDVNGTNYYDALGNPYKVGLGETADPLNPHVDYMIYKNNIRDELIAQMSSKFRLGLSYNKNGIITDQYWSSEQFDPTSGVPVNVNNYHYYYDKAQRLVGADYRQQSFASNPFAYFDDLAPVEFNEFDCEPAVEIANQEAEVIAGNIIGGGTGGNGGVIGNPKELRAINTLYFIRDEYLKTDINWTGLSTKEQDGFIEELMTEAEAKNIDFKAFEEVLADRANDQNYLVLLQSKPTTQNEEWSFTGSVQVEAINVYAEIDASMLKYTRSALTSMSVSSYVPMRCKLNAEATIYGFLPEFDISGTQTNADIYDAAYWYSGNGNLEQLHRKANTAGVYKNLTYTYSDPTNNELTSVDWFDGLTTINTNYTYDELGNLTYDQENNNTIAYEFFTDLPISIVNGDGTKEYRYNTAGIRTVKIVDGNKEFYLDGVVLAQDQTVNSYQTATGYAIPSGIASEVDFFYNIKDWLGTNRVVVDEASAIRSARDHYPYGMQMPGRGHETDVEGKRYQFTGHEFDNEVNYGYHGARYYNRAIGRYMSIDPLASTMPSWSPYNYVFSNPVMLIDPDGRMAVPPSTHLDDEGKVVAVFDDGDNGVYQHGKNADGGSVTEYQLSKRAEKYGTSSNGTKVGETAHWDEFVSPETKKTMTNITVQVGKSFDPIISEMAAKADGMYLEEVANKSGKGGDFDIKVPYSNVGGKLNGKYATSRSAGNYLAGYNAQKSGSKYIGQISFETFQKLAGALHVKRSLSTTEKVNIVLTGKSYGPAPTYGEEDYQYRMSKAGWEQSAKDHPRIELPRITTCFVKGTKVTMKDGTNKNIEDIRKGDEVMSVNIETMELEGDLVLEIPEIIKKYRKIEIVLNDNTKVEFSPAHPFWVVGKGWSVYDQEEAKTELAFEVSRLEKGDVVLKLVDGQLKEFTVESLRNTEEKVEMYNVEYVERNHSFFANGILVHNKRIGNE